MRSNKQSASLAKNIALLLAGAGIGAGAMYVAVYPVTINKAKSPVPATYYGVKIGSTKDEVGYKLGYPTQVFTPFRDDPDRPGMKVSDDLDVDKFGNVENNDTAFGQALEQFDKWRYIREKGWLEVEFDNSTKGLISITCMGSPDKSPLSCPKIAGIGIGTSEGELFKKLGKPTKEDIVAVFKYVEYAQFGLRFMLDRKGVYLITLSKPSKATMQK